MISAGGIGGEERIGRQTLPFPFQKNIANAAHTVPPYCYSTIKIRQLLAKYFFSDKIFL
jgi:hypothetical protein